MSYLFDAIDEQEENAVMQAITRTIQVLKDVPDTKENSMIGFEGDIALVVARLIDIGAAPAPAPLSNRMREYVMRHGSVKLNMPKANAEVLAKHIEIGLLRHRHGVNDPAHFVLH